MKIKLYHSLPHFAQNVLISIFNLKMYKKRYGGRYRQFRKILRNNEALPIEKLQIIQDTRLNELFKHSKKNSSFYREKYNNISGISGVKELAILPIISKEEFRRAIEKIYTIQKTSGIVSKTGGTTGKSLEVRFTKENMQERFAFLDNFRSHFGYELGRKTAWFSGKNLLTKVDIKKNRFWKTDYFHKVRYYSTFHIQKKYLEYYIDNLITFQPEFLVGFPSTIYEIANYGIEHNIDFPAGVVKAIFPTAESITPHSRNAIEKFFKTTMYDQYASSEGAPFIFECKNKNLHLEMQSGIFEVLDDNNLPAKKGRLVITSFTTYGTPLIRYDIEDQIELSDGTCDCGNNNPLVKQILGRIDDYVYSPENGKINLGNVSNTLKDVKGIIKFQAVQGFLEAITVKIVIDKEIFTSKDEKQFLTNWKDRVGTSVKIELEKVDDIPVEKSGKFRMVKNNIKHLVS